MLSQSLSEYQWENRLIIVFTESDTSEEFQNQIEILNEDQNGLKDRKLKVLHAVPGKHQTVLPNNSGWQDSNLYEKKKSKTDFEVILIGLDGGVKLRQTEPIWDRKIIWPYRLHAYAPSRNAQE